MITADKEKTIFSILRVLEAVTSRWVLGKLTKGIIRWGWGAGGNLGNLRREHFSGHRRDVIRNKGFLKFTSKG